MIFHGITVLHHICCFLSMSGYKIMLKLKQSNIYVFSKRDRETERERQRDRETERQRDRETERQRDREKETLRHLDTETQRDS